MAHTESEKLSVEEQQLLKNYVSNPPAFKQNTTSSEAHQNFLNNSKCMLALIRINRYYIQDASVGLKNNKEFMLAAIQIAPELIFHASKELKNNQEFMLVAISIDTALIHDASKELKNNQEFMLKAIQINSRTILEASDDLKNNEKFMLEALKINPNAIDTVIRYASQNLRNNKEFMLAAMKINPNAIRHASKALQNNKEFMLEAIRINPEAIYQASDELQLNVDFMLEAYPIAKNAVTVLARKNNLKNNSDFMLGAMRIDKDIFKEALGGPLMEDQSFMLEAIAIDPTTIIWALPPLSKDPNFYTKALIQTPEVAYYVSEYQSILEAIKTKPVVIAHLDKVFLKKNPSFINDALASNPKAIEHLQLTTKYRPSFFWEIQRSELNSPDINRYKNQFLMLESSKALASIAMATVGVLLVASVISSPFALALGIVLIASAALSLGLMTQSHLNARNESLKKI